MIDNRIDKAAKTSVLISRLNELKKVKKELEKIIERKKRNMLPFESLEISLRSYRRDIESLERRLNR